VAVAANLCAASIGTETNGSIIGPAMANGVVGIKPTAGLLGNYGIVPISTTLDTPGPMARTVKDAATLLGCLKNIHGNSMSYMTYGISIQSWSGYPENTQNEYIRGLETAGLRNLRIGIYGGKSENSKYNNIFEEIITKLEEAGVIITKNIQSVVPQNPGSYMGEAIAKHEFKRSINHYLKQMSSYYGDTKQTLQNIIEFNKANKEATLKYGQDILLECQEISGRLIEPKYIQALRRRETAITDLDNIFASQNLDILLCPSEADDAIAPLTGFPSGTIPIGFREDGVPVGLYFIARRFDEVGLIRAMYAVEQLVGDRQMPKM
jgi:amidase